MFNGYFFPSLEHFIPRSDFILFVTSVDRPFSESEVSSEGAHSALSIDFSFLAFISGTNSRMAKKGFNYPE